MHAAAPGVLNRVFAEALTERLRRHDRLEIHANRLHDGAAGDPRWLGRALLLRGYSARYRGQVEQAKSFASAALAILVAAADPAGCAACREPPRRRRPTTWFACTPKRRSRTRRSASMRRRCARSVP